MDKLTKLILKQGIWCAICVMLIFWQNQRLTTLESWVREKVITVITANTAALAEFKNRNKEDADTDGYKHE